MFSSACTEMALGKSMSKPGIVVKAEASYSDMYV